MTSQIRGSVDKTSAATAQKPPRAPRLGDTVIACVGDAMAVSSPLLFLPAIVTQHRITADGVPDGSIVEVSIVVGGIMARAMPVVGPDGNPIPLPRLQPAQLAYSQTPAIGTWRFPEEHTGDTIQIRPSLLH